MLNNDIEIDNYCKTHKDDKRCACIYSKYEYPECTDPECYMNPYTFKLYRMNNNDCDKVYKTFCSKNIKDEKCSCFDSEYKYPYCFDEKCYNNKKAFKLSNLENCRDNGKIIDYCKDDKKAENLCTCINSTIPKPHCFDKDCKYSKIAIKTKDMLMDKCNNVVINCDQSAVVDGKFNSGYISQFCGTSDIDKDGNVENYDILKYNNIYYIIMFIIFLSTIIIVIYNVKKSRKR